MQVYTDKEVLADGLCAQKGSTNLFNMCANECTHDQLRATMLNILSEEHKIQEGVFNMMHQRGFYETPAADETKIQQAKQKFSQGFKQV